MDEVYEQLNQAASSVLLDEAPVQMVGDGLTATVNELHTDEPAILARNVENMSAVSESLESFVGNFLNSVPNGDWDRRIGRQFELGVGAIAKVAGISLEALEFTESFEDVGVNKSGEEHRTESQKKAKNIVHRIGTAIWEAIKRAIEWLMSFFDKVKRAQKWLNKATDTLAGKMVQARQQGHFREGAPEKIPSWSKYLVIGNTTTSPSDAMTQTMKAAQQVADAAGEDIADQLDYYFQLFAETEPGIANISEKLAARLDARKNLLIGLHWPIHMPGGVTLTLQGKDKPDYVPGLKVVKEVSALPANHVKYISADESTRFVTSFREMANSTNALCDSFYRHARKYDHLREKLRDGKLGISVGVSPAEMAKHISHYNGVIQLLVGVVFTNAKQAYEHAMASIK